MDGGLVHRGPLRSAEHRRASRVLAGEAGRGHGCPRVRAGAGRAVKRGPLDDREAQGTARQEGARRTAGGVLEVQEALHKQGLLLAPRKRRETPCRLRRQNNLACKTPAARSRRDGRAQARSYGRGRGARRLRQERYVAVALHAALLQRRARTQDASSKIDRWRLRASALLQSRPRLQEASGDVETWRSRASALLQVKQRCETHCRLRRQNSPECKAPAARSERGGRAARSAPAGAAWVRGALSLATGTPPRKPRTVASHNRRERTATAIPHDTVR